MTFFNCDSEKSGDKYLILLGDGIGACSAMAGSTDLKLSVGRRTPAVRDESFQISFCL